MLRFVDVFGRWEPSALSQLETAELLRMGERTDNRVVMPGATKESLKARPEFHYTARG
jgi:hypothetical protein